jgi:hypothetical protein
MSTKIYNGFRINLAVAELFTITPAIYNTIGSVTTGVLFDATADVLLTRHRDRLEAGHPLDSHDIGPAWREVTAVAARAEELQARSVINVSCDVAICHDPTDRQHMYGIVFGSDAHLRAVTELADIDPYPYWNNTDRPSTVTDEEWEHRRAVWNRAVPSHRSPAEVGVMISVSASSFPVAYIGDEARFKAHLLAAAERTGWADTSTIAASTMFGTVSRA